LIADKNPKPEAQLKLSLLDAMALIYVPTFAFSNNHRINPRTEHVRPILWFLPLTLLEGAETKRRPKGFSHRRGNMIRLRPTARHESSLPITNANRQEIPEDLGPWLLSVR
jgi:hypothetical protein